MAKVRWFLDSYSGLSTYIWLLALVTFINRAGSMVIPFLSIYLTSRLGFSLQETAFIMVAYGAGSVVGVFAGGSLTDRWGYYKVQYLSLAGSGVAFFIMGFIESFWGLVLIIFIATLFTDSFRPASMASISAYSNDENRTRSVSLIRLAINFGFSIGPVAAGLIVAYIGYSWIFHIDAASCLIAGALVVYFLEDIPVKEEAKIEDAGLSKSPYHDKRFLIFCFFTFLLAFIFFQLFTTVPTYWKTELGIMEDKVGWLFMINGLLLALVEVPLVYFLEDRIRSIYIVIVGTFLVGFSFIIFSAFQSVIWMAIGMFILSIGEIGSLPFTTSLALKFSKAETRGQYMSVFGFSFSGAQLIAPSLGLSIAGIVGFPILFQWIFVVSIVSCIGFFMIRKYDY